MPPRQVVAVVNPRSQNGALGREWPGVAKAFRRELGAFEHVFTTEPGHATELARQALADGADLVVAVGGDGTIHEVANGFFDEADRPRRAGAALGVLPFGTGGDFRRTAQIPREHEAAARVLATCAPRAIDVGRLEYQADGGVGRRRRLFVNVASFGIGGLVDRIVNRSSKALGGKISFFLGTARAAMQYRNQPVRMVFDGNEQDYLEMTINNVAIANGRYFGGGMKIAPQAQLDDGKLDVVVLGDLGKLDLLKDMRRVYDGSHLSLAKVRFRTATRVEARAVDADAEVLLDVDGEAPGALPATFTLLPRALPVVMPATEA